MADASGAPPLVLHVDINKTLIISDPVSGVETAAMVDSLLSECSWGVIVTAAIDASLTPRSWRLVSAEPSSSRPAADSLGPDAAAPDRVMTYNEYLEGWLKPDKALKKRLKGRFTEPGEVGEALRPWYNKLMTALQIPQAQRDAAARALPKLAMGQFFILPSFFALVNHLEEQGRDFHLVFRTFGVDTAHVAEEWNLFCDGLHPCFSPARPARTRERRLELPRDSGALQRTSNADLRRGGVHLAMVDPETQLVALSHGLPAIHARIMAHLTGEDEGAGGEGEMRRRRSLALQDDYAFWAEHAESDDSGKLLIVDSQARGQQHLFFDDNIERDRAHIVDARDLETGRPLIKVEPWESILDLQYFVKALEAAEGRIRSSRT